MEVQKQVSPGSVQFTATMKAASRRAAYLEPSPAQYLVLDLDGPQVARADAEEGELRRCLRGWIGLEAVRGPPH